MGWRPRAPRTSPRSFQMACAACLITRSGASASAASVALMPRVLAPKPARCHGGPSFPPMSVACAITAGARVCRRRHQRQPSPTMRSGIEATGKRTGRRPTALSSSAGSTAAQSRRISKPLTLSHSCSAARDATVRDGSRSASTLGPRRHRRWSAQALWCGNSAHHRHRCGSSKLERTHALASFRGALGTTSIASRQTLWDAAVRSQ